MQNNDISAVLFDLDGTLLDTAPTFAKILNLLLDKHGKEPLDFSLIRETVSDGARALVTLGFALNEEQDLFEVRRNELLDLYEKHLTDGTDLFDGMLETLERIESLGLKWGIVTNKPSRFTNPLLEQLLQNNTLPFASHVTICPDDVLNTKPDPEPLFLACDKLGLEPSKCLYVGDHERDILAARAASMTSIVAKYGYIKKNEDVENWKAEHIIQSPKDLLSYF